MVFRLLLRWTVLAAIIGVVAWLLPGVEVHGGFVTLLWIAVLFVVVNATLGSAMRVLGRPLTVLTLGLFRIVINGAVLAITAWLTDRLDVDNFGWAMLGGLLIAAVATIVELAIPTSEETVAAQR